MRESRVRQIPGESRRRWFSSADFDLIVWFSSDNSISGFELCYDKTGHERAISWKNREGYRHMAVDTGEHRPDRQKQTPILVQDDSFDATSVHAAFMEASRTLPAEISAFVLDKLKQHPAFTR